MTVRHLLTVALTCLALAGCAGPMDRPLVTDQGDAAYFQRLNPLFAQMTPEQQEAFNWSVSDLTIGTIHQRYPGASARAIIAGETALVLATYPEKIAALQPSLQHYEQAQRQLAQLRSDNILFRIEQDFHGLQPYLQADFHNASQLSFSTTGWVAQLFLNDSDTAVASYEFTLNHRNRGGLVPGESEQHRIHLGFVTGDAQWMTLEVRNASARRIQILPTPAGTTDLGERPYALHDPQPEIDRLQGVIEAARKYQTVL